ncbi:hypothetical protein GF343_01820 [Candidatus Woesearchaeota archaeon]|nr:hypothetical protein [Candidatus Woesearchaeota archaeon]
MDKQTIGQLEAALIESLGLTGEKTAKFFGKAKNIGSDDKLGGYQGVSSANEGNMSLTEIDLENQERILQNLHRYFPWVSISVEERTKDPTDVQAEFYKNDSDVLVQIDPIDGTFCYSEGKNDHYGAIASVLTRAEEGLGRFVLAVMYYPSLDGEFLIANPAGVFREKDGKRTQVSLDESKMLDGKFCTVWVYKEPGKHPQGRLRIGMDNVKEHVDQRDIYANTEWFRRLSNHEIPGFLTQGGHINDHTVAAWMAQQWGADVEYASGDKLDLVPFGDTLKSDESRDPPRDKKGLLIIGSKKNPNFKKYAEFYNERITQSQQP